nr:unnamed protein product [Callosobruchus chinensis]
MSNIPQTFLIILKLLGIYPSQRHAYKCYVMVLIAASMCSFGSVTYTKDAEALVQQRNLIADLDQSTVERSVLKIRKLKKLHNWLCEILESFNGVFGPIILLEAMCAMSLIIQYTLEFMYLFVYRKYLSNISAKIMVNGLLFVIQNAVKLFALATVGQLVYGEAHSTIAISYRSINELEAKDLPELHFIKTELLDLIQQVHIRNPKVIASSFFDVNFSMAGFVVASITSYIIVALQFMVQGK